MREVAGALLAGAITFAVGHALSRGRLPGGLSRLELRAARIVIGFAALTVACTALADLGLLTGRGVLVAVAVLIGVGRLVNPTRPGRPNGVARGGDRLCVAIALTAGALALPSFEWSLGGRDGGTYVNETVQLQRRGAIEVVEPALASLPPAVRAALPLGGRYPGEYFASDDAHIVRLGFHAWPAVRAAAGFASGDEGRWLLPALTALAIILAALLAARLVPRHGPAAAITTAILLATSVATHWFARLPMTEIPALALLAGGLWLWAVARPVASVSGGALAGALLGLTFLLRPDGLFTIAAVAGAGLWWALTTRLDRAAVGLVAATAITGAVAFGHVGRFSWTYFAGNWDRHAHALATIAPIATIGLAALLAAALARQQRLDRWIGRNERRLGTGAAVAAIAVIVVVVGGGRLADWNGGAWLTWYTTWPGILLTAIGLVIGLRESVLRDRGAVLVLPAMLLIGTLLVYGIDARVAPDHLWAARRFVSVALPLCAVFAGVALAASRDARGWRRGAVALLLASAVTLQVRALEPVLRFDEYDGSTAQLQSLDAALGEPETLVITPWLRNPDGRIGVPLRVRFDRLAVPAYRLDREPIAGYLASEVRVRPVRLVTMFGRLPPLGPGVTAVRERAVEINLPELDQTVDRLPRGGHRLRLPLVVYRLVAA